MGHSKATIQQRDKRKLLTVQEYAATRVGWRQHGVNASYIYKLIRLYNEGAKTAKEIGFQPVEHEKSYLINPLT
jgi:hypothetical protein